MKGKFFGKTQSILSIFIEIAGISGTSISRFEKLIIVFWYKVKVILYAGTSGCRNNVTGAFCNYHFQHSFERSRNALSGICFVLYHLRGETESKTVYPMMSLMMPYYTFIIKCHFEFLCFETSPAGVRVLCL